MKNKKFLITTTIISTRGCQTWSVKAENKQSALEAFLRGKAEFLDQEIEVTASFQPTIEDVEEYDNRIL